MAQALVQQPVTRAGALPYPVAGGRTGPMPGGDHATASHILAAMSTPARGQADSGMGSDLDKLVASFASAKDHDDKGAHAHHWRDREHSHPVIENIARRFHWGSDLQVTLGGTIQATMVALDNEYLEVDTKAGALATGTGIATNGAVDPRSGMQRYRLNLDDLLPTGFVLQLSPLDETHAKQAAARLATRPLPSLGLGAAQIATLEPDTPLRMVWTQPDSTHLLRLERFERASLHGGSCTIELRALSGTALPVTASSTRTDTQSQGTIHVFHIAEKDLPSLGLQLA